MAIFKSGRPSILWKIKNRARRLGLIKQIGSQAEVLTIPIDACRHYCAFRYGSNSFNPYENYIVGLSQGISKFVLKAQFEEFLRFYRPRDFGAVYGLKFSKPIPLWCFPWHAGGPMNPRQGWPDALDDVPDIITHFCERGIRRSRVEEEYFWMERALNTISARGYQPEAMGYITVSEFRGTDRSVYLVTDGNHRLSALVALGHRQVVVKRDTWACVSLADCNTWPQVQLGRYTCQDATALFDIYVKGVDGFVRAPCPAPILDE